MYIDNTAAIGVDKFDLTDFVEATCTIEDEGKIYVVLPGAKKEEITVERCGDRIDVKYKDIVKEVELMDNAINVKVKYEPGMIVISAEEKKEVLAIE